MVNIWLHIWLIENYIYVEVGPKPNVKIFYIIVPLSIATQKNGPNRKFMFHGIASNFLVCYTNFSLKL